MGIRKALTVVALVTVTVLALAGGTAGAVTNPDYTEAPPPSTVVSTPAPAQTARQPVSTAVRVAPLRTRLAITGSDTMFLAVVGAGLVGSGVLVLGARRRRTA